MKRATIAFALSTSTLLLGASSCSSCDSCRGPSGAADAGASPTSDARSTTTASATTSAAPSALPPMEANYACRMLARAITSKACDCPQKNKMGCCFFGAPGVGAEARAPFVSCSGGKTDWPSMVEDQICKVGKDEKRKELLMGCYAAKERLRCGRTEAGDVGAEVPRECETLLKEALGSK